MVKGGRTSCKRIKQGEALASLAEKRKTNPHCTVIKAGDEFLPRISRILSQKRTYGRFYLFPLTVFASKRPESHQSAAKAMKKLPVSSFLSHFFAISRQLDQHPRKNEKNRKPRRNPGATGDETHRERVLFVFLGTTAESSRQGTYLVSESASGAPRIRRGSFGALRPPGARIRQYPLNKPKGRLLSGYEMRIWTRLSTACQRTIRHCP